MILRKAIRILGISGFFVIVGVISGNVLAANLDNSFGASGNQKMTVQQLTTKAKEGSSDAMMQLFIKYSNGPSAQDWVKAYAWGSLALIAGFSSSEQFNQELLDSSFKESLTPEDFKHAKELLAELQQEILPNSNAKLSVKESTANQTASHDIFKPANNEASS